MKLCSFLLSFDTIYFNLHHKIIDSFYKRHYKKFLGRKSAKKDTIQHFSVILYSLN